MEQPGGENTDLIAWTDIIYVLKMIAGLREEMLLGTSSQGTAAVGQHMCFYISMITPILAKM